MGACRRFSYILWGSFGSWERSGRTAVFCGAGERKLWKGGKGVAGPVIHRFKPRRSNSFIAEPFGGWNLGGHIIIDLKSILKGRVDGLNS